jgi:hypothetical protein
MGDLTFILWIDEKSSFPGAHGARPDPDSNSTAILRMPRRIPFKLIFVCGITVGVCNLAIISHSNPAILLPINMIY